ncbi:MAG: GAF domain-containing protein [Anaerolineae bacterium]|nr:GAF domain-containing protein [Anaerolineae bacterium]
MSIRLSLVILILMVGILPIAIAVFGATSYMEALAIDSGKAAMEEIGRTTIYDQATTTAQQLKAYFNDHPEIDTANLLAYANDETLKSLGVQPVGKTGYTAIVDDEAIVYFHPNEALIGVNMSAYAETLPDFWRVLSGGLDGTVSAGDYDWLEADGSIRQKYMVVMPVAGTRFRVAATTYLDEFSESTRQIETSLRDVASLTRRRFVGSIVLVGLVSLALALGISVWLTTPLREMAEAAVLVSAGKWDAIRPSQRRDELGVLNQALYNMTVQVRNLVTGLENQVAERTQNLERRARYLEATSAVARGAASVLNLEELLSDIVNLVGQQFGFYHVALFLLSTDGDWIELRAASSEGGQRLLSKGYRLRTDAPGLVSSVVRTGESRLALDVEGEELVFSDDPEISATRSELVLPLNTREQVLGVLDVHSRESEAFDSEDVHALQSLADQIAVAINNAYLFRQVETSAEAERRARGESQLDAWQSFLHSRMDLSYRSTSRGTVAVPDLWYPEMLQAIRTSGAVMDTEDGTRFAIPIQVAGQVIGVIQGRKPQSSGAWTSEDIALMDTLSAQFNAAVERARLYQETQRSAARERAIADVTSRMREPLELEDVLKAAVSEIRQALDMDELSVRLTMSGPAKVGTRVEEGLGDDEGHS